MRYGASLFEAADSSRQLDKVDKDLNALSQTLKASPELNLALVNPTIPKADIEAILMDMGTKLKITKITMNFLRLLSDRNRANLMGGCIAHYKDLLVQKNNQLRVVVTSRAPLNKKQLSKIEDMLSAQTGKEIILDTHLDERIIGGIIVNYGSYKLDFSLKTKLNELKHELERLS